ncbi:MAG: flagellar biosynthesis protein FlhB [Pseudomonadota bacterium]
MSQKDTAQERTEQATPKRLADARRKGQVARSKELTTALVMVSGAAVMLVGGSTIVEGFAETMTTVLSRAPTQLTGDGAMLETLVGAVARLGLALLPLFAVLVAAAILASVALGGWSFSVQALGFKFERIDPLKGLGRVFSLRGLVELGKALGKFALVGLCAAAWLRLLAPQLLSLSFRSLREALTEVGWLALWSLLLLSATLILIALVDVPFQLWQHTKNLKMTRQEVRDEQKDTDGRPEVKAKIRQLQQQQANARMMEAVPEANVVITNPEHYAVAVRYDAATMAAPVVVARGRDLVAARIREIARRHEVPVFHAPPLARALFRHAKLGQQIPFQLYKACAQVLAYLVQLDEWRRGGPWPDRPIPDVDPSLDPAAEGDKR